MADLEYIKNDNLAELEKAIEYCSSLSMQNETYYKQSMEQGDVVGMQYFANLYGEYNQIYQWLTKLKELKIENKELKRYLREAIAGFRKLGEALNDEGECDGDCENCALYGNCCKWRLESEVLVLIDRRIEND